LRQTLFVIPYEVAGVPIFGYGLLLAVWVIVSLVWLVLLLRRQSWREMLNQLPVLLLLGAVVIFLPKVFPFGLPIRGYGVMMLLGAGTGVWLAMHRARQMGIHPDVIFSLAFWMFLVGIVGARLFYVIEYAHQFFGKGDWLQTLLAIINVPQGGLVVYGSLIGALVAFVWFVRRQGLPVLATADLIAPSLAIGLAFGRIGCLLNGCCYGGVCDLPWAVTFPPGSPPYITRDLESGKLPSDVVFDTDVEGRVIVVTVRGDSAAYRAGLRPYQQIEGIGQVKVFSAADTYRELARQYDAGLPLVLVTDKGAQISLSALPIPSHSRPSHPTQIYSAINALLLCFFLWQYYPFRRRDGEVLAWLLTIYPITRFVLEVIRTDEVAVFGTGLSISQNVSVLILMFAAGLWWYVLSQERGSALPVATS